MNDFLMLVSHPIAGLVAIITSVWGFCSIVFKIAKTIFGFAVKAHDDYTNFKTDGEKLQEVSDMLEANQKGTLAMIRMSIVRECQHYLDNGWISAAELTELSDLYDIYRQMGGNSTAQKMFMAVQELPIKSSEK